MTDLFEAGDILSEYVGYGAVRQDGLFDNKLSALTGMLPERLRTTPPHAYRSLTLSAHEHAALMDGSPLVLRPRLFGSWTRDEAAAYRITRGRVARLKEAEVAVLIRKALPPGCVIADVEAVYLDLGWNDESLECWSRYASWERELIVCQPAGLLTVRTADVVRWHAPGDLAALAPVPGERAYSADGGEWIIIGSVPDLQPDAASGVWAVAADGKDTLTPVFWNWRQETWDMADADPAWEP